MLEKPGRNRVYALLDQQDRWISLFSEYDRSGSLMEQITFDEHHGDTLVTYQPLPENSEDVFTEFARGIFFLKECLLSHFNNFSEKERLEIQRRLKKQTTAIKKYYHFLERSLRLAI